MVLLEVVISIVQSTYRFCNHVVFSNLSYAALNAFAMFVLYQTERHICLENNRKLFLRTVLKKEFLRNVFENIANRPLDCHSVHLTVQWLQPY